MLTIEVTKHEMSINGKAIATEWYLYMSDGFDEDKAETQKLIGIPISQDKADEILSIYPTTKILGSADSGQTTYQINIS